MYKLSHSLPGTRFRKSIEYDAKKVAQTTEIWKPFWSKVQYKIIQKTLKFKIRKYHTFNAQGPPKWSQNASKKLIEIHADSGIEKTHEKHKKPYLPKRKNMPKQCKGHQKSRFRKFAARP